MFLSGGLIWIVTNLVEIHFKTPSGLRRVSRWRLLRVVAVVTLSSLPPFLVPGGEFRVFFQEGGDAVRWHLFRQDDLFVERKILLIDWHHSTVGWGAGLTLQLVMATSQRVAARYRA